MRWSDVTQPPTDRQLRQFATTGSALFAFLAAWCAGTNGWELSSMAIATVAAAFAAAGAFRRALLRPVFILATILTFPLGWLVSKLLLTVVYLGLITPLGLLLRACGIDPLDRKPAPGQDTYWKESPRVRRVAQYWRQF